MRRRAALCLVALVIALATGCGGSDAGGGGALSATEHNEADVAFATDMIQHHAQALAMVNLTVQRPVGPGFRALAEGIRDAQGPEIETMTDWLEEWDEPVPETVNDHMNHDMGTVPEGTEDLPGMMTAAQMHELEEAGDADFEAMWLDMMIRHHRGAIDMAEIEVREGRFEPAVGLAGSIQKSQTDEIEQMQGLLD